LREVQAFRHSDSLITARARVTHYDIGLLFVEFTCPLIDLAQRFQHCAFDARVHNVLGNVACDQEQFDQAMEHYRLAIEIRRCLGNRFSVASVLNNLALCSHARGELDEAETLFTESLSLYREIDDRWSAGSSLCNLVSLALARGDAPRAPDLYHASLDIRRELGDLGGVGLALNGLGQVALQLHDHVTARLAGGAVQN
jgi:tetratricopeptide (TPR) repeat protein